MEFTAARSSPSPAFAGSLPLFAEERRPQLILVCRSRRILAAIRGSPSGEFAGNQLLFAASSSPPPFAAHVSPLVTPLAQPSSSSSPLVCSNSSSSPLVPPSSSSSPLVLSSSTLPESPLVPLGLLVDYVGMVWSPAPEPAPHQRPPVPAPHQRPPVPAPRQCPPVPTPPKCSQVPPLVLPSSSFRDFFCSATKTLLCWLFADAVICRWNTSSSRSRTSRSDQLADSVIPCSHPASIQRTSLKEQILRRCCKCSGHYKTCRSLLHADDTHAECVMLGEIPRWLCTQRDWLLSLQEFQSCLSALVDSFLFRERLCPSRPPIFFLPRTCEEKTAGQRIRAAGDKRAHAGSMPTCLAITTESIRLSSSPNTISVPLWLRATWSHSVWVTTNWMTAFLWQLQTRKGLSGSVTDPALLSSSASRNARLRADEELIRVMTKAVNKLGLEWSPPEEPFRSRLDKWFLPGRHQALRQRSSPFFPEIHDELTKSWRIPYSSRIRPSASAALTSVDGAEEKGYEHLPPLDESVAAHLCPPTAIGWKARASHPSKPCGATSAFAGCAYSAAGQAA